jgi:hypothetical protein
MPHRGHMSLEYATECEEVGCLEGGDAGKFSLNSNIYSIAWE